MNEAATKAAPKQFKVVGWFEEVMRQTPIGWKLAGKREIQSPPPGHLGVASEREFTITAPLALYTGCGTPVELKATPSKPVQIKTRCYPICGPLET
jgi:hypothetical protein